MGDQQVDLSRPRYDQSSYFGRVRHFLGVVDPMNLFISDDQLKISVKVLEDYEEGKVKIGDERVPTEDSLWYHKSVRDAIIHPDTKEPIPLPMRWAFFIPANVPMLLGMQVHAHSMPLSLFWQFANQSYNVAVNYGNRNASLAVSNKQIATAYASAVTVSMGTAALLKTALDRTDLTKMKPLTARLLPIAVPYVAVASAGCFNVMAMRWSEAENGVFIRDDDGEVLGTSRAAGKQALFLSAVSRVTLPAPVLLGPPLITAMLEKLKLFPKSGNARLFASTAIMTATIWAALPACIGLFPQDMKVDVTSLEEEFWNLKDKNGNHIKQVTFNKGT